MVTIEAILISRSKVLCLMSFFRKNLSYSSFTQERSCYRQTDSLWTTLRLKIQNCRKMCKWALNWRESVVQEDTHRKVKFADNTVPAIKMSFIHSPLQARTHTQTRTHQKCHREQSHTHIQAYISWTRQTYRLWRHDDLQASTNFSHQLAASNFRASASETSNISISVRGNKIRIHRVKFGNTLCFLCNSVTPRQMHRLCHGCDRRGRLWTIKLGECRGYSSRVFQYVSAWTRFYPDGKWPVCSGLLTEQLAKLRWNPHGKTHRKQTTSSAHILT